MKSMSSFLRIGQSTHYEDHLELNYIKVVSTCTHTHTHTNTHIPDTYIQSQRNSTHRFQFVNFNTTTCAILEAFAEEQTTEGIQTQLCGLPICCSHLYLNNPTQARYQPHRNNATVQPIFSCCLSL